MARTVHARRADQHFALLGIVDGLDIAGVPGEAQRGVAAHAADPAVFPRLELGVLIAEQGLDEKPARRQADRGAVARGHVVEVIGHRQAGGARHVLNDHAGLAGEVLGKMPRQQARIHVVAGAGPIADQDAQRLAAVEVRNVGAGPPRRCSTATIETANMPKALIAVAMLRLPAAGDQLRSRYWSMIDFNCATSSGGLAYMLLSSVAISSPVIGSTSIFWLLASSR